MRRCGTGCVAVAVALALATPDRAMASPPSDDEIAQLYGEAQRRYEARDYMRAAESWTRLLNMLEASPENREIRESVILNVLDAHLEAYRHLVDEQGNKDILHLRRGEATLVDYYSSFVRVHGERVAMSRAVHDKAEELEQTLREAIAREEEEPASPVPVVPEDNGNGLIVGGSAVVVLGIAALVMIPVGSARGKMAEARYNEAISLLEVDPGDRKADEDRRRYAYEGRQANAMLIAGAVLAPLLLAGGATMIGFGAQRKADSKKKRDDNRRRHTLVPAIGPSFAGFSLSGRF